MPVAEKSAEKKKRTMAKAAITNIEQGVPNRALSVFTRSRDFLRDVRAEMRKVVTPSWKEVQSTTTVVIVCGLRVRGVLLGRRCRAGQRREVHLPLDGRALVTRRTQED